MSQPNLQRKTPLRRSAPKRKQPKRYWVDARKKVERERVCRVNRLGGCKGKVEAAHTVGREHDPPLRMKGGYDRYVLRDAVFPLCQAHHRMYDRHELDALPFLTIEEQVQAVKDAGGIVSAYRRLTGERQPAGEPRRASHSAMDDEGGQVPGRAPAGEENAANLGRPTGEEGG